MAEVSRGRLIAFPALVTLAVTLLRLFGELQHWSPILFRREPGGLGAVVGIIWLAPIFGVYFALKLVRFGSRPVTPGRALAHALLGVGLFLSLSLLTFRLWPPFQVQVVSAAAVALGVILLQMRGWASLCKVLLLYAVAARVPVVLVMFLAIHGNWGTHYDAFPTGFPLTSPLEKWFWGALLAQLTLHVGNTVLLGSLFGSLAAAWVLRQGRNRLVA